MKQDNHVKLSQTEYRECVAIIHKVNDMLGLFVSVNLTIKTSSSLTKICTSLM